MNKYIKYVLLMIIFVLIGAFSMNFYAGYLDQKIKNTENVEVFVLSDNDLNADVNIAAIDDGNKIEVSPIA